MNKIGRTNVPGEGYIVYYMDVDAPINPARPAINPFASGGGAASESGSYTWFNVASGFHTFSAQLVNNDLTSLSPPVVAKVSVIMALVPPTVINLVARNGVFSFRVIKVGPGIDVVINLVNNDVLPHNFAVYDNRLRANLIFRGAIVSPGQTMRYEFKAPSTLGAYFFTCDVHPEKMDGSFNVQEPGS